MVFKRALSSTKTITYFSENFKVRKRFFSVKERVLSFPFVVEPSLDSHGTFFFGVLPWGGTPHRPAILRDWCGGKIFV